MVDLDDVRLALEYYVQTVDFLQLVLGAKLLNIGFYLGDIFW